MYKQHMASDRTWCISYLVCRWWYSVWRWLGEGDNSTAPPLWSSSVLRCPSESSSTGWRLWPSDQTRKAASCDHLNTHTHPPSFTLFRLHHWLQWSVWTLITCDEELSLCAAGQIKNWTWTRLPTHTHVSTHKIGHCGGRERMKKNDEQKWRANALHFCPVVHRDATVRYCSAM